MVGVARAVQVHVPGVGGELLLVLGLDLGRVGGLGQHLLEEVDVAGVVDGVELPRRGVAHDDHSALPHQGLAPVEVEEVAQPQAHHQHGVHDRVDVVGTDVGQPHGEDVGLTLDRHHVLAMDVVEGAGVHGLDLAGLDAGGRVRRADGVEDGPRHAGRGAGQGGRAGHEGGPVPSRPLPLPPLQEAELGGEGVGVQGGLDLEHLDAGGGDVAAHAPVGRVQLRAVLVHERAAVLQGADVVVVAQAAVGGQPGGHALVAPVHGHQVDVHVHHEVAGGGPLADLHVLARVGAAQVDQAVGVLGVVLQQKAVGRERVVHAVAHGVTQLRLRHAPVQREGGDEHDVVHAGLGGQVEHGLDHPLADVGPAHGRKGEGDVVEGDGEAHARPQQGGQRRGVAQRLRQRPAYLLDGIGQGLQRLGRVHDPAARGQALEAPALAVPEQRRRGGPVHLEHESGPGAHADAALVARRSKATFTPPRRPAAAACSIASR